VSVAATRRGQRAIADKKDWTPFTVFALCKIHLFVFIGTQLWSRFPTRLRFLSSLSPSHSFFHRITSSNFDTLQLCVCVCDSFILDKRRRRTRRKKEEKDSLTRFGVGSVVYSGSICFLR
jgi:hypothetical protein